MSTVRAGRGLAVASDWPGHHRPTAPYPTSVRVLVMTPFFEPAYRGGGPIQTLGALVRASPSWADVVVVSSNSDLGDPTPLVELPDQWIERDRARVWYATPGWRSLISALHTAGREKRPGVVYLNSLFDPRYSLLPQLFHVMGWSHRSKLLLAPRGELNVGALAIKPGKKRAFLAIYRLLGLHKRVLWHASTSEEADDIRRTFGESAAIVVRENETSLPLHANRRTGRAPGPCRLVFASRAVPKKGLLTLLLALRQVSAPLELDIVGAFENAEYQAQCQSAIDRLPPNIVIQVSGPLPRDVLLRHLRNADALSFPTEGENFGHVIAEALSEACPVICSAKTPWTTRLERGGGFVVVPSTPVKWAEALQRYACLQPTQWKQRSEQAADVFDSWISEDKGKHVFELALERPN